MVALWYNPWAKAMAAYCFLVASVLAPRKGAAASPSSRSQVLLSMHINPTSVDFLREDLHEAAIAMPKVRLSLVSRDGGLQWVFLGIGIGAAGGTIIGALTHACISKTRTDMNKIDRGGSGQPLAEVMSTSTGAAEVIALEDGKGGEHEHLDYEKLLRLLSQRVAQAVGPKLAKGQAIRSIVEDRFTSLQRKTKTFFLNEFNCTAGALLKAIDAEEAALLLDWNNAVAKNLPPLSVLLAGLLSPTLLTVRQIIHMLMLFFCALPIFVLCAWAIIYDWGSKCVIPGIYIWSYVQGGLALILSLGHLMMYFKIRGGKATLVAKAKSMNERLTAARAGSAQDMGAGEMRELFVCSSVLLQQALMIEDSVRHSFWTKLTGAGSVLWILTMIWDFVIVLGWTFWPGMIAFHPKAEQVAPEEYCGARVTVFVARLTCVLHVVFLVVTVTTTASWISDLFIDSPSYGRSLVEWAEHADQGMLGIPVMQTLVKAFVLRGRTDLASSQLAVTVHDRVQLERQLAEACQRVEELGFQIKAREAEEAELRAKAGSDGTEDLQASISQLEAFGDKDMLDLKNQGSASIEQMQGRAAALEQATTKELEALMQRITEVVGAVQDSDMYKSAVSQGQVAADFAAQHASEVAARINAENLQNLLAQAEQAVDMGVSRAKEVAGQIQDSESLVAVQATLQRTADTAASSTN